MSLLGLAGGSATAASATTSAAAAWSSEIRVGASTLAAHDAVGLAGGIAAGQSRGEAVRESGMAVATGVAAKTTLTTADDWPIISGIVRDAAKGKGNFGLGSGTAAQAETAGRAWVGDGAKLASDGKTWVSGDGLRQWRPPSFKPRLDMWQSNLEWRWGPSGAWQGNGHLDIMDMFP